MTMRFCRSRQISSSPFVISNLPRSPLSGAPCDVIRDQGLLPSTSPGLVFGCNGARAQPGRRATIWIQRRIRRPRRRALFAAVTARGHPPLPGQRRGHEVQFWTRPGHARALIQASGARQVLMPSRQSLFTAITSPATIVLRPSERP